ncbi:MAG: AbrB/MazE/SpoVT family DNA-binding domain-containing protein [Flavobacteriaceae bacterium]|nr:AbrB/MazE/SpoVT family DNA-binding domain-containing protein [Flavobacteriaceae bacterium]
MEATIIKIGNSRGLRLSKPILDKYKIKDKVSLILEEDKIILKPIREPRKGWEKAFREMCLNNDDTLIIDDVFNEESFEEWS